MATQISKSQAQVKDALVVCQNSQMAELHGTILHLTRHLVIFEIATPVTVLRLSEALTEFRIFLSDRLAYSGRAVVNNLVNTGTVVVCEAHLEDSWVDVDLAVARNGESKLEVDFQEFMRNSQDAFRILPDFKLVVADMQILLQNLHRWLEQIELGILSQPSGSRQELEREIIQGLHKPILPVLGALFEKFEASCGAIEPHLQPAHRNYVKRQLHSLVLCAPFMYRTFQKPLGYAGDYEMVSMMLRDPAEGGSLFAKVLNTFFLSTPPVIAHRNRIEYLKGVLTREVARVVRTGRDAKIFNLGCGPAREVQDFIIESELSARAQFTLLDFNEETLMHIRASFEELKRKHNRVPRIKLDKKSVHQLLKEGGRSGARAPEDQYDMVYCAGLFDYLSDQVCKRLMNIFYDLLAPGGLLVATNVTDSNPSRNWMEYSVDWHLAHRSSSVMAKLVPDNAPPDSFRVLSEPSSVNAFLEVRKPEHD
jgi:extracellular factor (EF) 3-hydroxypalmitic acid methyl ester biosynthesis protein